MTDSATPTRSAFSYRAFTMFLIGRIVSILSFQMLVVAIGWQLYTLTDSALDLGLLGIAQFVPMFVLTPLVGHAVDRYDNRIILLICQLGEAGAAATLALGTMTGQLDPLTIYVIIALVGAGRAFEIATMVAIIPALVPRPVVPSATAWFASSNQIGLIVGPVLGGLLYGLGPGTVYGLAVSFWCFGASFIFLIHMENVPRASEPVSLQSLVGGFDFVWRDRVILGTISLDMCAVFLAAAPALYPVFARDILETGPWGLGLLRAAPGVGAFAMSVVLAHRPLTLPIGEGVVRRSGHVRRRHYGVCAVDPSYPVAGRAGRDGGGRRRERGDPLRAGAVAHAGRDARTRQRRQRPVHRHLELSRRFSAPAPWRQPSAPCPPC
jgi:MFS family permease